MYQGINSGKLPRDAFFNFEVVRTNKVVYVGGTQELARLGTNGYMVEI